MRYESILAAVAALGLAACGPDLSTESRPPEKAAATPAQPAEPDKPAVAQAAAPGAESQADRKEEDKKDDGEKKPQ
jgi:hypothetical protein